MPHIIIILDAEQTLEGKSSEPPTAGESNLMEALQAADNYAHNNPDAEVLNAIEQFVGNVNTWMTVSSAPLNENRLNSYANGLNGMIP